LLSAPIIRGLEQQVEDSLSSISSIKGYDEVVLVIGLA
jgi:hypothetical protein